MGFKENLKTELLYTGMLVKELSVKTGIKKYTIDNYLSTHSCTPSAEAAVKIAQALGVSVEYLVTGIADKHCGKSFLDTSLETRLIAQCTELLDVQTRKMLLTMIQALQTPKQTGAQVSVDT